MGIINKEVTKEEDKEIAEDKTKETIHLDSDSDSEESDHESNESEGEDEDDGFDCEDCGHRVEDPVEDGIYCTECCKFFCDECIEIDSYHCVECDKDFCGASCRESYQCDKCEKNTCDKCVPYNCVCIICEKTFLDCCDRFELSECRDCGESVCTSLECSESVKVGRSNVALCVRCSEKDPPSQKEEEKEEPAEKRPAKRARISSDSAVPEKKE